MNQRCGKPRDLNGPAGPALLRATLKSLEQQLDPARFVRVHRSAMMNLAFVREVVLLRTGEYAAVLSEGSRVPVSHTCATNSSAGSALRRGAKARDAAVRPAPCPPRHWNDLGAGAVRRPWTARCAAQHFCYNSFLTVNILAR